MQRMQFTAHGFSGERLKGGEDGERGVGGAGGGGRGIKTLKARDILSISGLPCWYS